MTKREFFAQFLLRTLTEYSGGLPDDDDLEQIMLTAEAAWKLLPDEKLAEQDCEVPQKPAPPIDRSHLDGID